MKCELCGRNTKCLCRGGGCSGCGQTNPQVEYTNKILKLGVEKDKARTNMGLIHSAQKVHVDAYIIYDFLANGHPIPAEYAQAIEKGKSMPTPKAPSRSVISDADTHKKLGDNPNRECKFEGTSPRGRCIYCGGIKHYMKGKNCPAFKGENK